MKKCVLAILDGVGYRKEDFGNAVNNANMTNYNYLLRRYSNSLLDASGESVGLPSGQMGNSEVGHLTIGSGRVVLQPLLKIEKSIKDGSFSRNDNLLEVINHVKSNNSKLHIFGLLSDGGIHSHIDHIFELIKVAKDNGINKLYLHMFTDGRDTLYNCCCDYFDKLNSCLKEVGVGSIATICGRYYAMDREFWWDRTKKAYDAMVYGKGNKYNNYNEVIKDSYEKEIYDEYIEPAILDENGLLEENDGLIMANFRPDRITQLFRSFTDSNFTDFKVNKFKNIKLVTMMPVDERVVCKNIFPHEVINNALGEVLSNNNYRVLRISEICKYPHVTHFFDGDKDAELLNTDKISIPSKNVATYDMAPGMSSNEVTDKILEVIDDYDFIVVNYANGDMVGHTGNYEATIKGLECVDTCINRLYDECIKKDYLLIVIADHGNSEEMKDMFGNKLTTHTTNKVRMIVCDNKYKALDGDLSDIAPSILRTLGLDIPKEMTGNVIIKEKLL